MSGKRVFIDFGSTFTKVVAFDLDSETLLGRVQAQVHIRLHRAGGLDPAQEGFPL